MPNTRIAAFQEHTLTDFENALNEWFDANKDRVIRNLDIVVDDLPRVSRIEPTAFVRHSAVASTNGDSPLRVKMFTGISTDDVIIKANAFNQNVVPAAGMSVLVSVGTTANTRNLERFYIAVVYCEHAGAGFNKLAKEMNFGELSMYPITYDAAGTVDEAIGSFNQVNRFVTTSGPITMQVFAPSKYRGLQPRTFLKDSFDNNIVTLSFEAGVLADGETELTLNEPYDAITLIGGPDGNYRIISFAGDTRTRPITANAAINVLDDVLLCDATGGGIAITLPDCVNGAILRKRRTIVKVDNSPNTVRVEGFGGQTIDASAFYTLFGAYERATFLSDGVANFITSK